METVEPVWITGVGAATPLGCELAEIEANLLAGRSGVSLVTRFPTDDYPSRIAAQLRESLRPRGCDFTTFSARQPLDQLAHWCVESALRDADLWEFSSRGAGRAGAGHRGGVDAALGGRQSQGRHAALRPGPGPRLDDRAGPSRAGALGAGAGAFGGLRQRQPCARDRPPLASARAGGRLRGGGLRPGGHADRPGDVRQPAGVVETQRRSGRRVTSVRPRPRRLRPRRGGSRVRPRAGRRRPPPRARMPMPRSPAAVPAATPITT